MSPITTTAVSVIANGILDVASVWWYRKPSQSDSLEVITRFISSIISKFLGGCGEMRENGEGIRYSEWNDRGE